MGDIADQLINDIMFGEYDEIGECFQPKKSIWKKRTPSQRKIASIRKEIAIAVNEGIDIQEARKQANLKYGKGWRERGLISNSPDQWTEEDLKQFKS
jgi:hypothetical protein